MADVLVRYLHFIGIFCIVGSLVSEHLMLAPRLTRAQIRKLAIIDSVYGLGAILVLGAGFLLWFVVGKPASFYTQNWVFHFKVTLFVVMGLLSIYPTLFFRRNQKGDGDVVEVPKQVVMLIRLELLLLMLIPLLAVMMARGIGYFG